MRDDTIRVDLTWKTTMTLDVPDGATHDEAVAAFNDGEFGRFEEFDSSTAELTDWRAS